MTDKQDCTMPGTCHWGEGKVALVTGSARRVGRATVLALHKHGYNVVIHCNNSKAEADALAEQLNGTRPKSAHVISGDLSVAVAATAQRLVAEAQAQWGRLDLLVNNASLFFLTPLEKATERDWDQLMDTNVKAPFFLTQAAAPHLKATRGGVINLGDVIGEQASPPLTIYGISKAALIMATKNHAIELGPEVRVNYICPGAVAWPEVEQDHHDDAFRKALVTTGSEREWKVCERSSSSLTMATTATGRTAMPESQWGEGRVALVTGGARRVGRATVFALHRRGFNVVVHCNNSRTEAQAVADELNSIRPKSAHVISGDLSVAVAATAQRLVAEAQAQWGRLDLLVNNASLFFPTPIAEASEDTWTRLMNTNAMSPFFLMKAAAPHVKEVGGSIINIGDIGGETPTPPYFTIYSMTKAALIMATKQLAIELAPEIRVNYINPGAVIWPETDVGNTYQKEWLSRTPLGREGTGEDVAEAAVFLASPAAAYITGSSINVCGGRSVMT